MKTGLLMSVVMVGGMVGAVPNVRAACTTTPNCESLGYKYCASECPNGSVACPFDSNKRFCFSPKPYTVTAESCAAECKNGGSQSCTRGGVTYYNVCGTSKCSNGQTCSNGTCESSMIGQLYSCCDSSCSDDYIYCQHYFSDCSSYHNKCRNGGGTPRFQDCSSFGGDNVAIFSCEMQNPVPKEGKCCGYSSCSTNENWCQSNYSKNCYRVCTEDYGLPDCNDMQASCKAQGGSLIFQRCGGTVADFFTGTFKCE